jgi:hypothetical protein
MSLGATITSASVPYEADAPACSFSASRRAGDMRSLGPPMPSFMQLLRSVSCGSIGNWAADPVPSSLHADARRQHAPHLQRLEHVAVIVRAEIAVRSDFWRKIANFWR